VRAGYTWGDGGHHETSSSTASVQVPPPPPSGETVLSHHDWLSATSGWLTPKVDQAVGGGPLAMNGTTYSSGIGVASPSTIAYYLGGKCDTLAATVGIDDSTNFDPSGGTASFRVAGDGQTIYDSGLISRPTVRQLTVPMSGRQVLVLEVGDGGDGGYNDRTDWADVHVRCAS
jgi:alpha-galactosidase